MNLSKLILASLTLTIAVASTGVATAQSTNTPDPGHPRVNEVQQRINNQQARVDRGVSDGQINAKQAARDDAKLGREQTSLNQDQAKNGGHITKAEQSNLNNRLNKGSQQIHQQRHPAQAPAKK